MAKASLERLKAKICGVQVFILPRHLDHVGSNQTS
jgi:hypothetical protein